MYVYLFVFLHPHEQIIMALSCKSSLYKRNKGYTKPVLYLCTGKFCLKGGFLFPIENQLCRLATDYKSDFPSGLFWHSTTEIHQSRPLGLLENVYLVTSKVGMACSGAWLLEVAQHHLVTVSQAVI